MDVLESYWNPSTLIKGVVVFSGECHLPSMVIAGFLLDFHPDFTCSEKRTAEWKGKSPCLYKMRIIQP